MNIDERIAAFRKRVETYDPHARTPLEEPLEIIAALEADRDRGRDRLKAVRETQDRLCDRLDRIAKETPTLIAFTPGDGKYHTLTGFEEGVGCCGVGSRLPRFEVCASFDEAVRRARDYIANHHGETP